VRFDCAAESGKLSAVEVRDCRALAAAYLYSGRARPEVPAPESPRAVPFTSYPGQELAPSFSPEGDRIAFTWNGERGENPTEEALRGAAQTLRRLHPRLAMATGYPPEDVVSTKSHRQHFPIEE
jgi:hypothetical protein